MMYSDLTLDSSSIVLYILYTIGEQGVGLEGGYPPLKKKL